MKMSWTALAQKWLEHRWTPAALALAAVVVMLPALDVGLGSMDDLLIFSDLEKDKRRGFLCHEGVCQ